MNDNSHYALLFNIPLTRPIVNGFFIYSDFLPIFIRKSHLDDLYQDGFFNIFSNKTEELFMPFSTRQNGIQRQNAFTLEGDCDTIKNGDKWPLPT